MVCREIETPACATSTKFTHMLRSQIPILISGHRRRVHWTLRYKYIPAPPHCRGTNYLNISIYICLYLTCLRQTNCLG